MWYAVTVKRRVSQRAYLNGAQKRHAAKLFGCTRVVYNDFIGTCENLRRSGVKPDWYQVSKTVLTEAKKTPERQWLFEVSAVALQQSVRNAQRAYKNFYASRNGTRKGPKINPPSHKTRKSKQSAHFTHAARFSVRVDGCSRWGFVRLPGFGEIKFRATTTVDWTTVSSVTLKGNPDGTFEVSFVNETVVTAEPSPQGSACGVDLGLKSLAAVVSTDGTRYTVANRRHLRVAQRKLARLQKAHSRKEKGSKNREKQRVKVAKLHSRVARSRKDHLDKFSRKLARENQTIGLETLSIAGMGRTRLAKSVYDAGWGMLNLMVGYKAAEHGGEVKRVGRWEPTTQVCSWCKHRGGRLPLSVREWTCTSCGTHLDRDFNAAVNIMDAVGHTESLNACGGDVRLRLAEAVTRESGTHRERVTPLVGISTL